MCYTRLFYTFITMMFISSHIFGQKYNSAIGIRLGTEWGASFNQRVSDHSTLELIAQQGIQSDLALVSLMWRNHFNLGMRRLNLYAGGGPHIGIYTQSDNNTYPAGVSLITGAELAIAGWLISWDIKPVVNIINPQQIIYLHSGLSIRYILNRRDSRLKEFFKDCKWKFWNSDDRE